MFEIEKELEDYLFNPLVLLSVSDKSIIDRINNYLPYSIGFEIECNMLPSYNREHFSFIPDILNIRVDAWEQRYRIPNGIQGLICLYNICHQLKLNSELNFGSGIHYHVDCEDVYKPNVYLKHVFTNFTKQNWILKELDSWEYKGTYNNRLLCESKGGWLGLRDKSIECRIGEMSFDYTVLVKRILHLSSIVKRLKSEITHAPLPKFNDIDKQLILNYLRTRNSSDLEKQLTTIQSKIKTLEGKVDKPKEKDINQIIKSRIIKI